MSIMISVITAVRNDRKGLETTLRSVSEQSGVTIEHVVVDGDSTDGTQEVIRDWSKTRVLTWLSEPDTGVYDAFNKGLQRASGDVIGFLNAGDVFAAPDVLQSVQEIFEKTPAQVVYADVDITDERSLDRVVRRYSAKNFDPSQLLRGFMPPHPATYMRRSVVQQVGEYDVSLKIAGDFDWAVRFFLKQNGWASYLPRTLVKMPAGGLSNRGWRSLVVNTMEMHAVLAKQGLPASWWALLSRLPRKWIRR
jgi:glycosyltransferase involved in cell wall biosynthesis